MKTSRQAAGVKLPDWMQRAFKARMSGLDVTFAFTYVLREHGTAAACRTTAERLLDQVPIDIKRDLQQMLKRDDAGVIAHARHIAQSGTDHLGIHRGAPVIVKGEKKPCPSTCP